MMAFLRRCSSSRSVPAEERYTGTGAIPLPLSAASLPPPPCAVVVALSFRFVDGVMVVLVPGDGKPPPPTVLPDAAVDVAVGGIDDEGLLLLANRSDQYPLCSPSIQDGINIDITSDERPVVAVAPLVVALPPDVGTW